MSKSKLMIIAAVLVVALVGGAFATGKVGGKKGPVAMVAPEPISMTQPFIVNVPGGTDGAMHYAKVGIALQLGKMDPDDLLAFEGPPAGGEGGGEASATDARPGAMKLGSDPVVRNAVIGALSKMSVDQLLASGGNTVIQQKVLSAVRDAEAEEKASLGKQPKDEAAAAKPPWDVTGVLLTDVAVQ